MKRLLILLVLLTTSAFAQGLLTLHADARVALERAQEAAQQALATYVRHNADFPLWRQAIGHGQEALNLAPDHPAPLRFLAEAYTTTQWYARAWDMWRRYLGVGGQLDAEAQSQIAEVGTQIAYLKYEQNDLTGALEFYRQILDYAPDSLEPLVWSGRILLELEQPDEAIPYWQEVLARDPADQRAAYFLQLARDQARWGVGAANAFYEGVSLYEAGDLHRAQMEFARAGRLNPDYTEAWAWLGRTYFEGGRYEEASIYYRRALELAPEDETYQYFARESERRLQEN